MTTVKHLTVIINDYNSINLSFFLAFSKKFGIRSTFGYIRVLCIHYTVYDVCKNEGIRVKTTVYNNGKSTCVYVEKASI